MSKPEKSMDKVVKRPSLRYSLVLLSACFVFAMIITWLPFVESEVQARQQQRLMNQYDFSAREGTGSGSSPDALNRQACGQTQERVNEIFAASAASGYDLERFANRELLALTLSLESGGGLCLENDMQLVTFHKGFRLVGAVVVVGGCIAFDPNSGHVISLKEAQTLDTIVLDEE